MSVFRRGTYFALPVASVFLFGATCTLVNDTDEADALRASLGSSLASVDATVNKVESFNTDFLEHSPTYESTQNNLTLTSDLDDELVSAQATLEQVKPIKERMVTLHMPDWYHNSYAAAASDQIDQRVELVTQYQTILSTEENFVLAVTSFYNGLYTFYAAIDTVDQLPPISIDNTDIIRKQVRETQADISQATTDFNSSATYVNVELFTRMRDSAVNYQQALDTLHQMVVLLDQMQVEIDDTALQAESDQMDQLSYTLDELLGQFSDSIPTEYLDENDGFTDLAMDDFVDWRVGHLDSLVGTARALSDSIQQIDLAADTIYTRER